MTPVNVSRVFFSYEIDGGARASACNECPKRGTQRTPLIYMFCKYSQLSDKCSQLFHHLSNWLLPSSTIHLQCNAPDKNVFCLLY